MAKKRNTEAEQSILNYLAANQKLSTKDAISLFHLSESTIRRIFINLEKEKKAVRTFGGIMAAVPDNYYSYDLTSQKMQKEKALIGNYAAGLIHSSDFIYIDCGTTTEYLARAIAQAIQQNVLSGKLNIVTNSLVNLEILNSCCNVILTGGTMNEERRSLTGSLGISFLSNFHFSKAFLGADGMTFESGFSSDNIHTSHLSRAALLQTNYSYVLLDSSKIGRPSYVNYAELDEVTALITDSRISEPAVKNFANHKIQLHIASTANNKQLV